MGLLGFDFASGYAAVIYVLGGVLVLIAAVEKLYGWGRWLERKARPEPPQLPPPSVTISAPSASIRLTHDEGAPHRRLAAVEPEYAITNFSPDLTIREVKTGVRRREGTGGDHQFDWHGAPCIEPKGSVVVDEVAIPEELLRGVHESLAERAFIFWARFTDDRGQRWEASRDATTGVLTIEHNPPPLESSEVSPETG